MLVEKDLTKEKKTDSIFFMKNSFVFLATFSRRGPIGKWDLIRKEEIQSVFPHSPKTFLQFGFGQETDYRRVCDQDKVICFMNEIERGLNAGMTASEAEIAFPRANQHNREIFKCHLMKENKKLY